MVRSEKVSAAADVDEVDDSGTMVRNATVDNTMIRNSTGVATMTSEMGTMVINDESEDGTMKSQFALLSFVLFQVVACSTGCLLLLASR